MPQGMAEKTSTPKKELTPIEVGVGAAAAVITAFASSYLGTAGTLTGAALASVVGTVSTSMLRTSVRRTNDSLLRTTARLRQGATGPEMGGGATAVDPGLTALDDSERAAAGVPVHSVDPVDRKAVGGRADEPPALAGTRLGPVRRPAWAVVAAGAVAAFVVALIAITGIESAAGKPLAALIGDERGGGTTIGRTVGSESGSTTDEQQDTTPTPAPSVTGEESADPTDSPAPTDEPSTQEATPSPTAEPTGVPTTAPPATQPAPTTPAPTP